MAREHAAYALLSPDLVRIGPARETPGRPSVAAVAHETDERGVLHGRSRTWHDNGALSSAAWFSHGSPVGIARRWSTTGILVREDRFADDGDRCGDQRSWHDSGQPRSLIGYDAGRLDGRCQVWLASGTLVRDGRFCAGRIDGEWRQFAPDGRLLGSFAMRHGNGEYREWHDRGQIRRQGRYRDGKMHGQWTQRSSTGEMLGVLPFQDGSGTFRSWRDDGVVAIEGVLLAGGRVGSWSYATTGGEHEHIDFGNELAGDRVDPWLDPVAPP